MNQQYKTGMDPVGKNIFTQFFVGIANHAKQIGQSLHSEAAKAASNRFSNMIESNLGVLTDVSRQINNTAIVDDNFANDDSILLTESDLKTALTEYGNATDKERLKTIMSLVASSLHSISQCTMSSRPQKSIQDLQRSYDRLYRLSYANIMMCELGLHMLKNMLRPASLGYVLLKNSLLTLWSMSKLMCSFLSMDRTHRVVCDMDQNQGRLNPAGVNPNISNSVALFDYHADAFDASSAQVRSMMNPVDEFVDDSAVSSRINEFIDEDFDDNFEGGMCFSAFDLDSFVPTSCGAADFIKPSQDGLMTRLGNKAHSSINHDYIGELCRDFSNAINKFMELPKLASQAFHAIKQSLFENKTPTMEQRIQAIEDDRACNFGQN